MKWTVLAVLLAAGCASGPALSADQCAGMDWYALGKRDGQAGQSSTAVSDEIAQCEGRGLSIDAETYRAGRAEGLKSYCAPAVLLDAVVEGLGDPRSCDPMTDQMRISFDKGRQTRTAVARYQQLKLKHDQLIKSLRAADQRRQSLRQRYNQERDPEFRRFTAIEINAATQDIKDLNAEIARMEPLLSEEQAGYQAAMRSYEAYKASLSK